MGTLSEANARRGGMKRCSRLTNVELILARPPSMLVLSALELERAEMKEDVNSYHGESLLALAVKLPGDLWVMEGG